jgi:hypothetical protein
MQTGEKSSFFFFLFSTTKHKLKQRNQMIHFLLFFSSSNNNRSLSLPFVDVSNNPAFSTFDESKFKEFIKTTAPVFVEFSKRFFKHTKILLVRIVNPNKNSDKIGGPHLL